MKWLEIEYIKQHARIDMDCDDALLEQYALGTEDAMLALMNRTFENIMDVYGEVPAPIVNASLLIVAQCYQNRETVSSQNLSPIAYSFDFLIRDFILLSGRPLTNERDGLVRKLMAAKMNLDFFCEEVTEERQALTERYDAMCKKMQTMTSPTTMMLAAMREKIAKFTKDVDEYIKSQNE